MSVLTMKDICSADCLKYNVHPCGAQKLSIIGHILKGNKVNMDIQADLDHRPKRIKLEYICNYM